MATRESWATRTRRSKQLVCEIQQSDGRTLRVPEDVVVRSSDSIESELYDVHLPMLEEAGVITWDREQGTIEPGPRFEEFEAYLDEFDVPDC
ncbi:hypothetical protein BRC83_00065 [Halobacteriales archaeon QS_1_68_17]|nr:MAG: hypothetical protein BRC83_00065 [Halobacteriales archaeon QS_1_68_17]